MSKPVSIEIAEKSGLFYWQGDFLRPRKGTGFLERLSAAYAGKYDSAYILKANRPEKDALVIGGKTLSLSELADILGFDISKVPKRPKLKVSEILSHYQLEDTGINRQFFGEMRFSNKEGTKSFLAIAGIYPSYDGKKTLYQAFLRRKDSPGFDKKFLHLEGGVAQKVGITEIGEGHTLYILESVAKCLLFRQLFQDSFVCTHHSASAKSGWSGYFKSRKGVRKVIVLFDYNMTKKFIEKDKDGQPLRDLARRLLKLNKDVKIVQVPLIEPGDDLDDITDIVRQHGVDITRQAYSKIIEETPFLQSDEDLREPGKVALACDYLQKNYSFRKNVIRCILEYAPKGSSRYQEITEYLFNEIWRIINIRAFDFSADNLKRVLNTPGIAPEFDPVQDYYDSLPAWDGKTNHLKQLTDTIELKEERFRPWFEDAFARWFVNIIPCSLGIGKNETIVVLISPGRGDGKTTWWKRLLQDTALGKADMFDVAQQLNMSDKDCLITMSEKVLINLDEMAVTKHDNAVIKGTSSIEKKTVRRPYGQFNELIIRRASLCATQNEVRYLTDSTGTRRFLNFEVGKCDFSHRIDMNLVFSQALALWKAGFKYWFDPEENDFINLMNGRFETEDIEEELVKRWVIHSDTNFMTATDIAKEIFIKLEGEFAKVDKGRAINTGRAMRKHGFKSIQKKINKKPIHGYMCEILSSYSDFEHEEVVYSSNSVAKDFKKAATSQMQNSHKNTEKVLGSKYNNYIDENYSNNGDMSVLLTRKDFSENDATLTNVHGRKEIKQVERAATTLLPALYPPTKNEDLNENKLFEMLISDIDRQFQGDRSVIEPLAAVFRDAANFAVAHGVVMSLQEKEIVSYWVKKNTPFPKGNTKLSQVCDFATKLIQNWIKENNT